MAIATIMTTQPKGYPALYYARADYISLTAPPSRWERPRDHNFYQL